MTNVDLNKIDVLTDKTYTTEADSWTEYEGNFYESPFNNQAAYGQRYQSKNFDKSEYPYEGHTWYEKRPTIGADMNQMADEFNGNEIPYHQNFPRFTKKEDIKDTQDKEKFFTRPYSAWGEYVNDVHTTALPASGVEVPDLVEHFTIGGVDVALSSIILIIVCIIIIIAAVYYLYRKKKEPKSTNIVPQENKQQTNSIELSGAGTIPVDAPMPTYQAPVKTYGGQMQTEQKYNQSSTFALSEDW